VSEVRLELWTLLVVLALLGSCWYCAPGRGKPCERLVTSLGRVRGEPDGCYIDLNRLDGGAP